MAGSIRSMTLGGTFISSEEGWYGSPAVTMNLYDNRFVILCFQAHKKGRLEMLDGICKSWPDLVVGLKVETKVGAEPAGDGGVEVRVGGDARGATLQKRTKMLEGWTCGCSEKLVAMKTPESRRSLPPALRIWSSSKTASHR